MEDYGVNQFSYIRQRMEQLDAERRQAQEQSSPTKRISTTSFASAYLRSKFRHPSIVNSLYWSESDQRAKIDWFDHDPMRPDDLYKDHVRKMSQRDRHHSALRHYVDPGLKPAAGVLVSNTATLFSRMYELGFFI